ncbi:hypothetical protein GB937_000320 [Aspergillus fischeri]|nr:hypothetical protein GB937_000320 [Aspergillus fischeri]
MPIENKPDARPSLLHNHNLHPAPTLGFLQWSEHCKPSPQESTYTLRSHFHHHHIHSTYAEQILEYCLTLQNVHHSNINLNINQNHPLTPRILSVSKSPSHSITKTPVPSITLIPNHGVDGDCHAGHTTQHRAQAQAQHTPNLRQVHLVPVETLRELSGRLSAAAGADAKPLSAGEIGENITTEGVELSTLPLGTEVHFFGGAGEEEAVVVLTGIREPGPGMDKCRAGLRDVCVVRDGSRVFKRLAGVMGTVKKGGMLRPGMGIRIVKPVGGRVRPLPAV